MSHAEETSAWKADVAPGDRPKALLPAVIR
jgi:hypothetical protein